MSAAPWARATAAGRAGVVFAPGALAGRRRGAESARWESARPRMDETPPGTRRAGRETACPHGAAAGDGGSGARPVAPSALGEGRRSIRPRPGAGAAAERGRSQRVRAAAGGGRGERRALTWHGSKFRRRRRRSGAQALATRLRGHRDPRLADVSARTRGRGADRRGGGGRHRRGGDVERLRSRPRSGSRLQERPQSPRAGAIPAPICGRGAYRAALRVIFPDRPVAAALLYTAAPVLLPLADALLDPHAPVGG